MNLRLKKIGISISIILIIIIHLQFDSIGHPFRCQSLNCRNPSSNLSQMEQIHINQFIDTFSTVEAGFYYPSSVVKINITNLSISNTSLFFSYFHETGEYQTFTIWTPRPQNFTLTPGESFQEIYTLELGIIEGSSALGFYVWPVDSDSNATLHLGYDVLVSGTANVGHELLYTTFLLTILVVAVFCRKKQSIHR